MIRNHLLDPESSPSKAGVYGDGGSGNYGPSSGFEDDWYTNSAPDSPSSQSGGPVPGMSGSPQGNTYYQQSQHGGGFQEPGGPMNMNSGGFHGGNGTVSYNAGMYDNEPPLLEELGVRFDHIIIKTQAVMLPFRKVSEHILDDADLAGPIIFCLMLGGILLLGGKVHFGYIYGFSVLGCLGMNLVLNLMTPVGLDMWRTCSVLGYCLLPVVALGLLAIGLDLRGHWGLLLSAGTVGWSTFSSCRLFDAKLGLTDQYYLVAYPVGLLYSCFVLITIF